MPSTQPAADAIMSDLQQSISDLQARARQHVNSIDARIHELSAKQSALKIPRAAFVAKILEDIRKSARGDAVLMERRAKQAQALHAHFPTRRAHSVRVDGTVDFVTSDPRSLEIIDYKDSPLALVGMLPELFEPAITSWAERLANELGLPTTGSIDQVRKQSDALQAEIETLSNEREAAKAQLSKLIEVSGSPFISEEAFKRMRGELPPAFEPLPESTERPAGVYAADGAPVGTIGSDGWNEYWAKRRAAEDAEAAAEAAEAAASGVMR